MPRFLLFRKPQPAYAQARSCSSQESRRIQEEGGRAAYHSKTDIYRSVLILYTSDLTESNTP